MKKVILSMAVLATALANAQVGINEESPKATLDISVKKDNIDTNSQEGLLIPRVTKEKALLMANNPTTQPEESALIYVNDTVFTDPQDGTEVKVEDITEKGYYFWNGAKWVKSSGANGELWAQREINGITETYLKPADAKGDFVGYKANRSFGVKLGEYNLDLEDVPFTTLVTSDALKRPMGYWGYHLRHNISIIKENHVSQNTNAQYFGNQNTVTAEDITSDMGGLTGNHFLTQLYSNNHLQGLTGLTTYSRVGSRDDTYRPTVDYNLALRAQVVNNSVSTNIIAIEARVDNTGATDNIKGIQTLISSQNKDKATGSYPAHTIKTVQGIQNNVTVSPNATVEEQLMGLASYLNISRDVEMTAGKSIYGKYNRIRLSSALPENPVYVDRNIFELRSAVASAKNVFLNQSSISSLEAGASVAENVFGFNFRSYDSDRWSANNIYGVYLSSITNGTSGNYGLYVENVGNNTASDNYAIYTNNGDIRFGDLKGVGERIVTANTDGVLQTSTTSLSDLESLWANDDANNLVKLKATSNGTPRVNTPGSRNDVTIDDYGKITAKAFIGYNGATIFPDYVFEKYYTGESTIKSDYNFHNLASVESFIKTNGHLPGYQSAKEIASKGLIDLGATQLTNVEKIEELYLHLIEKDKEVQTLKTEVAELKQMVKELLKK